MILIGRCPGCQHVVVAASQRAYAAAIREHRAYAQWKAQRAKIQALQAALAKADAEARWK